MATDAAHTRWWQIFEVVFGLPLVAAIALHWLVPFTLPRGRLTPLLIAGGLLLISAGVALVILARQRFAQRGQPTDPGLPISAIITTGVFGLSRNPLYLGGVCVLAGLALVVNAPWVLVLLLPAIIACHVLLIAPEERYLAAKFGTDYRAYTASVPRWIGVRRMR